MTAVEWRLKQSINLSTWDLCELWEARWRQRLKRGYQLRTDVHGLSTIFSQVDGLRARLKLMRFVIIRPLATYECETLSLTKKLKGRLEVFENGFLMRIYGKICDQQEQRRSRRHNKELWRLTQVPFITYIIKAQRLRWAGHVVRYVENSSLREALDVVLDGRRPVGRLQKRRRSCVKEDIRKLGQDAAQDTTWRGAAAARGQHGLQPVG